MIFNMNIGGNQAGIVDFTLDTDLEIYNNTLTISDVHISGGLVHSFFITPKEDVTSELGNNIYYIHTLVFPAGVTQGKVFASNAETNMTGTLVYKESDNNVFEYDSTNETLELSNLTLSGYSSSTQWTLKAGSYRLVIW